MHLFLHLADTWARPVVAEMILRPQQMEVRCRGRSAGIVDRDAMRSWLREPEGVYAYDRVAWLRTGNGVALAIDDTVPAWPLADHVLDALRARV